MKSSGSLQRWMSLAALLAVAISLGAGGYLVDRTVRLRTVSEARSSLGALMRLSSTRLAGDTRLAMHKGNGIIDSAAFTASGTLEWLVVAPPDLGGQSVPHRGPNGEELAPDDELARTEGFPVGEATVLLDALQDRESFGIQFLELEGQDGLPYRVATMIITPAMDMPQYDRPLRPRRRDGPRGDSRGGFRDGPRGGFGEGGDREPPRGRRDGPGAGDRRQRPDPGPRFDPEEHYRVFVSSPLLEERAVLASLRRTLLWAGGLAGLLSFGLLSLTVRRGLRPVRQISAEISRVQASRLDQRLTIDEVPAELIPVVQAFEGTRERLAAAFHREKRFTADAAHELRTPLAGLRASLEVALRRERPVEHYRETMAECLGVTESMQGMVEALLQLAKGAPLYEASEPIQVEDSMRRAFAALEETLTERGLTVQYDAQGEAVVTSHPAVLERIASNLASNAACYATEESVILVKVARQTGGVAITVENEAGQLDPETSERAFEPLWRGDSARTEANEHAGLGLALVHQCVEALGGTVTADADGNRFAVRAVLPDATPASA